MKILLPLIALMLLGVVAGPVYALGTIRISPANPTMISSPATFNISVTEHVADDPHILLVMTKASYNGLTGSVQVTWTGGSTSFSAADFTAAKTGKVPPSTPDADYTVASLQDHLGVPHSENVYYALGPFLAGPITQTKQTFVVTLPSTAPKMLVYAIGKKQHVLRQQGASYNTRLRRPRTRHNTASPSLVRRSRIVLAQARKNEDSTLTPPSFYSIQDTSGF